MIKPACLYDFKELMKPYFWGGKKMTVRGMFEMNCLLSSSSISAWGTIKTNTYLYRAIQYLHNGV